MQRGSTIRQRLIDFAHELEFDIVGIARVERPDSFERYERWIQSGAHAEMSYLSRNVPARAEPNFVLPGVKSVLMLGVSNRTVLESEPQIRENFMNPAPPYLKVANYATGIDYHLWIRERLKRLSQWHREIVPGEKCRGIVDTAPFMERHFAQKAGLGRFGKNTMLIHPRLGSRFFLAAFLTTLRLEETEPLAGTPCGECQKCCDCCPAGALSPYFLDARKCWNYWTIEHRGEIPDSVSETIGRTHGGPIFGCDICQDVCPWNHDKDPQSPFGISLAAMQSMDEQEFRSRFEKTPLKRRDFFSKPDD